MSEPFGQHMRAGTKRPEAMLKDPHRTSESRKRMTQMTAHEHRPLQGQNLHPRLHTCQTCRTT